MTTFAKYTMLVLVIIMLNACVPDKALNLASAKTKPKPVGMFHSAGNIMSKEQPEKIKSSINDLSHVAGTLIRIDWALLQSGPGEFDFSLLDREFAAAQSLNTKIVLVIYDSKAMPDFVKESCETFTYLFMNTTETTCLPWDEQYQSYKKELIDAVAQRYDDNIYLAGIYFTYAAMTNGVEMHWIVDEAEFAAAGYTKERLVSAYNAVMDLYANAFKQTPVIMEIHNVFEDPFLATSGFEHCYSKLGERCGIAIWWCAERMTTKGESDVWPIAQLATTVSFSVCQTIGNFTNEPNRFDSGAGWTSEEAIQNEMSFFLQEGFTSWELWSADITNENFFGTIESINSSL